MKLKIDGHIVVVNKMSIYIDGKMEFQAINLITEYGKALDGCKYAVTSRYSKARLEELYTENLKKFSPFIYLTEEQYAPIRQSNNNDSKFYQRELNCHAGYEYDEEISESGHECVSLITEPEPDVLTRIIEAEEEAELEKYKALLPEALETLTKTQRTRITMYFYDEMTFRQIAEAEGKQVSSVFYSIQSGLEQLGKFFKKRL